MIRAIWFLCIAATIWFALSPPSAGGLGGTSYHGLAFLVLGLLTPAAFPRQSLVLILVILVAFGGAIELAQEVMQQNRFGDWKDFGIDVIAATVGIVYYRIWLYLRARMANEKAPTEEERDSSLPDRE